MLQDSVAQRLGLSCVSHLYCLCSDLYSLLPWIWFFSCLLQMLVFGGSIHTVPLFANLCEVPEPSGMQFTVQSSCMQESDNSTPAAWFWGLDEAPCGSRSHQQHCPRAWSRALSRWLWVTMAVWSWGLSGGVVQCPLGLHSQHEVWLCSICVWGLGSWSPGVPSLEHLVWDHQVLEGGQGGVAWEVSLACSHWGHLETQGKSGHHSLPGCVVVLCRLSLSSGSCAGPVWVLVWLCSWTLLLPSSRWCGIPTKAKSCLGVPRVVAGVPYPGKPP